MKGGPLWLAWPFHMVKSATSVTGVFQSQVVYSFSVDWVGVGSANPSWLLVCVLPERLGMELGSGIGDAVVGCWLTAGTRRGLGPFPGGSTSLDALAG